MPLMKWHFLFMELLNRHTRRSFGAMDRSLKIDYLHDMLDGHKLLTLACHTCKTFHQVKLKCGDRFCLTCRRRDYGRLYKRFLPVLKSAKYLTHLTLTIKNYDFLDSTKVQEVNKWLREFYNHPRIKETFRGGLSCQEIIHVSDLKGWNHHIHTLNDMAWISQAELSKIWKEISGNPIVWIKKSEGAEKDLKYLLKYMFKPPYVNSDHDVFQLKDDYRKAFFGSRSVNAHGSFYNSDCSDDPDPFVCPVCGGSMVRVLDLSFFYDYAPVIEDG